MYMSGVWEGASEEETGGHGGAGEGGGREALEEGGDAGVEGNCEGRGGDDPDTGGVRDAIGEGGLRAASAQAGGGVQVVRGVGYNAGVMDERREK